MIKFLFVRHGQTQWNLINKLQGSLDSPLTKLGISQAIMLRNKFKNDNINFSHIYTSPLGRAHHTADLISDGSIPILFLSEFQEFNLGKMEGKNYQDFEIAQPREYFNFFNQPEKYDSSSIEGESYQALFLRIKKGLEQLITHHKNGDVVLVVTHGITLRGICSYLSTQTLSLENFSKYPVPDNTSVTTVIYTKEKFSILDFSNTDHLK